jgi:hypothetical protein
MNFEGCYFSCRIFGAETGEGDFLTAKYAKGDWRRFSFHPFGALGGCSLSLFMYASQL